MSKQRVHYLHSRKIVTRCKVNSCLREQDLLVREVPNAVTFAYIIEKGTKNTPAVVSIAAAVCSRNDNFCRKTGREIAHERLTDGEADKLKSVQLQTGMRVPTTATEWRAFDRHVVDLFIEDQKRLNPVFEDVPW